MQKIYSIEVDCANCANLMEQASKKIADVADVTVNFMTQKMTVLFADGADEKKVMKEIKRVCKKVDSDFSIEL